MALAYAAVQQMMRETSGGTCNPAVSLAKIIWKEFTLEVDPANDHSQWTYEYATGVMLGPIAGAMMAGALHNVKNYSANLMLGKIKKDGEKKPDDAQSVFAPNEESFRSEALSASASATTPRRDTLNGIPDRP